MTGWRMGYGVMRPDLASQITRLMTNSNSCTASFTQMAGIEALRAIRVPSITCAAKFKRRRDVFVAGLNKIKGFFLPPPQRAHSMSSPTSRKQDGSRSRSPMLSWSRPVLAALSGHRLRRIRRRLPALSSVANSLENLQQALDRLDVWTQSESLKPYPVFLCALCGQRQQGTPQFRRLSPPTAPASRSPGSPSEGKNYRSCSFFVKYKTY